MEIDINLCERIGVSSAFVYSVIKKECEEKGVFINGHPYSYLPRDKINDILSFYSDKTIQRAINKLEREGYIESIWFIGPCKWRRIVDET